MEKVKIRIYDIGSKISIDNINIYFSNYGSIKYSEKIILNEEKYEYFLTFKCELALLESLKKKEKSNITFKYKIFYYNNYNIKNVSKKIFISKIKSEINKKELFFYFKQFGKISKIIVCKNTLNNKNFGFIYFDTKYSSLNLIQQPSKHYINGNWVDIENRKSNKKNRKNRKNKRINEKAIIHNKSIKRKTINDDNFKNKLTLIDVLKNSKRSNSLKDLSNRNIKISKKNLLTNDIFSKNNTQKIKNKIMDQFITNWFNN